MERPPCCKVAVAVKHAAREQFTSRISSDSSTAVAAAPLGIQPVLGRYARAPPCMRIETSPPLGPPLRLRI